MASRTPKNQSPEDADEPSGPGAWIVTFSDCMTLLLCFFVMLLTFSSFDEAAMRRLSGAFDYRALESIFPVKRSIPDTMVEPAKRQTDETKKGSEKPTDQRRREVRDPKKMQEILEIDAHRDRKVFFIPAEEMFWGNGLVMKDQGKRYLDMIASFLDVMPCFVIINESRADRTDTAGADVPGPALARTWQMVKYCTDKHGIPSSYFSIAADGGVVASERFDGRPVIEFALVAPRVYR